MKSKVYVLLLTALLAIFSIGVNSCNSDDKVQPYDYETVDYYGMSVPYIPMEEKDMPEWLSKLINEKDMVDIYRIYEGTLNKETIYNLTILRDSSTIDRFYGKDGHSVLYECGFDEFIARIQDLKCIFHSSIAQIPWQNMEDEECFSAIVVNEREGQDVFNAIITEGTEGVPNQPGKGWYVHLYKSDLPDLHIQQDSIIDFKILRYKVLPMVDLPTIWGSRSICRVITCK